VKPTGVGAGVSEKNDKRPVERCLIALACPSAHFFSVGRVAENDMFAPVASKAVILFGKVDFAFCTVRCRAGVKSECEFRIECIEELVRRGPLFGTTAVERFVNCHWDVSVSGDAQLPLILFGETGGHATACAVANNHGQQCDNEIIFKKVATWRGG